MARESQTEDVRTDSQKRTMAETFDEYEAEYRNDEAHGIIVHEDDECVIYADHTGHEINEWANEFDVEREELRQTFRALAEQKMGEKDAHEAFSHFDPVVFDKFDE